MGPTGGNSSNVEKVGRFGHNRVDKRSSVRFVTDPATREQPFTLFETSCSAVGIGDHGSRSRFDRGGSQGGH